VTRFRGGMNNRVAAFGRMLDDLGVGNVAAHAFPAQGAQRGRVAALQTDHLIAPGQELSRDAVPKKTAGAGDQNAHQPYLSFMVRMVPESPSVTMFAMMIGHFMIKMP